MQAGRVHRAAQQIAGLAADDLDVPTLLGTVGNLLSRLVPVELSPSWFLVDPASLVLTGHLNDALAGDTATLRALTLAVVRGEYLGGDFNTFAALSRSPSRVGMLSQSNARDASRRRRSRDVLRPAGFSDEMRAALVAHGRCWGGVALYRKGDFTADEAHLLAGLVGPIAGALRAAVLRHAAAPAVAADDSAELMLLDEHGAVQAITPGAVGRLAQMFDPNEPSATTLPCAAHAIAAQAQATSFPSGATRCVRARVPARGGGWILARATPLTGSVTPVTAVILETAPRAEILPLLLEAHKLSPREQEVLRQVLHGLTTDGIARALNMSPFTVQDHLKAIFAKVGVHSRRELMAMLAFDADRPDLRPAASVTPP